MTLAAWRPSGWRLSGDTARDAAAFLNAYGCPRTAAHSAAVAACAQELAANFALDQTAAFCAGWLHDISAIWPVSERLAVAEGAGLLIYAEERAAPLLLHQRLSALLAEQVFAVHDAAVLSALGCHTTLKAQAGALDLALFVADKLAWDQAGEAPFHAEMRIAAKTSLAAAARVCLHHLWEQRTSLPAVHPWLRDAWREYLPQLMGE